MKYPVWFQVLAPGPVRDHLADCDECNHPDKGRPWCEKAREAAEEESKIRDLERIAEENRD